MKKLFSLLVLLQFYAVVSAQPQGFGGFNAPQTNPTFKDVNYAGDKMEAHNMDIYLPDKKLDKYKVVVAIYGSAWFSNNMKAMTFMSLGKPLLDAGFAVVCINHRSSGDAKYPAQIQDVKGALRFIRANADKYKLDTSFVGITGFSSGGHLAAMAGVTNGMKQRTVGNTTIDIEGTVGGNLSFSSNVDAVVDWFGPVDMARMAECKSVNGPQSPEAALIGGAPVDNPDLVALISPITYVTDKCPKFLVFHGEADNVVPHCQGVYFSEVLKKAGRLQQFVSVPDGQHGPVTFNENTFKIMTDFFQQEASGIPSVYDRENTGSSFKLPYMPNADALPVIKDLPDPLAFADGIRKVNGFGDWAQRRSEIAAQIQHYGIGMKPAVDMSQVKAEMNGDTLTVWVTVGEKTIALHSVIQYPEVGQPPYALMIGTSGIALPKTLFEGRPIAKMTFNEAEVNDYSQWRPHKERGEYNFDLLYPELKDNGAYSEWAWGLSRLIDGLQLLGENTTRIDMKRIGVTGCSYAGKMALYCGAFDERIALTIAQEPGGGGAAAWRASHLMDEVENIDKTDYHWFLESQKTNFGGENVYKLPYDQHELCALVCPRALLLLGNPDYKWLADSAMLVSAKAAQKVWDFFGIDDRFGYSIVGGHPHCQLPQSQMPEVQAFIDKFLLGKNVDTANIMKSSF